MSFSLNKLSLIGNVGADPEVRATNGGRVASFPLATGEVWRTKEGVKQERTTWHRIIFWNRNNGPKLADVVEQFVRKGSKVYVEGKLLTREYTDAQGIKRYAVEVQAYQLILMTPAPAKDGTTQSSAPPSGTTTTPKPPAVDFSEPLDPPEDDDLPF